MHELVDKIHKTPHKVGMIVSGGGTEVFKELLYRGGGSNTLLFGEIPYDTYFTKQILKKEPEKLVSETTARQFAMSAFQKCLATGIDPSLLIGLGSTSSLQKTPEERLGREHDIYIAAQTLTKTITWSWCVDNKLIQDQDPFQRRIMEEEFNAQLIIDLLAEVSDIDNSYFMGDLGIKSSTIDLSELILGKSSCIVFNGSDLNLSHTKFHNKLIFPGSFNPIHAAHRQIAQYAEKLLKKYCWYEISMTNVDKPSLDYLTIEERINTLDRGVIISNAATFTEKARTFPNSTFVVGFDTLRRIIDEKYAGPIEQVTDIFHQFNTKFLVFGRVDSSGEFNCSLEGFPEYFRQNATLVSDFRCDISSTKLRKIV